jgi:hypothetical protein
MTGENFKLKANLHSHTLDKFKKRKLNFHCKYLPRDAEEKKKGVSKLNKLKMENFLFKK